MTGAIMEVVTTLVLIFFEIISYGSNTIWRLCSKMVKMFMILGVVATLTLILLYFNDDDEDSKL